MLSKGSAVPNECIGVKHGGFPWETPAGNGMLGGRPQLTAGIRAGSYGLSVAMSAIERQLSRGETNELGANGLGANEFLANGLGGEHFYTGPELDWAGKKSWIGPDWIGPVGLGRIGRGRNGSTLDAMALCLHHCAGDGAAARRARKLWMRGPAIWAVCFAI